MQNPEPFLISGYVDDTEKVIDKLSYHSLAFTLRLVADAAEGIPSCYVSIRYKGRRIAQLETNWRGWLSSVEILTYHPCEAGYDVIHVCPMNPRADMFVKV